MALQVAEHYLRDLEKYDGVIDITYDENTPQAARQLLGVDAVPAGRDESSRRVLAQVVRHYVGRDAGVDEVVGPRAREQGLCSLLHVAATHGFLGIGRLLLEWGVDPSDCNELRRSPLHMAAARSDRVMVGMLLEHGADPLAVHCSGKTALHFACDAADDRWLVKQLLDAGLDVNVADRIHRNTPLHLAVKNGCQSIARLLVRQGANLAARNTEGSTPAHLAAAHWQMLQLFVRQGADLNVTDAWGRTPLQLIDPAQIQEGIIAIQELIKQEAITGIPMNQLNAACIEEQWTWRRIKQDCLEDIDMMKNVKVHSTICFDLFCMSVKELGKFLQKNRNLSVALSNLPLEKYFPIYGKDLKSNIRKAYDARKHEHRVSNFVHLSLGNYLPQDIKAKIGEYLRPEDIRFK